MPATAFRRRAGEAVAAPGNGGDQVAPQHLAQAGHLHREVGLLHHQPGPHLLEQLALGQQLAGSRGHREQQVERACAQGGRDAIDEQAALARLQLEAAEAEARGGHRLW